MNDNTLKTIDDSDIFCTKKKNISISCCCGNSQSSLCLYMYWCVFVLPFRLLPHTRFTISLAHKNDAHVCIYCWKAASWYVTYVTPESYVPREPEMVCKRERENERTSEDNANTYFQAAISNVHYLFYLYVASHFDVYDLPQYPFSARTGRGISSFFYLALSCISVRSLSSSSFLFTKGCVAFV